MKEPTLKGSISPADWIKAIAAIAGLPLALYALVNAVVAAEPLVTLIVALAAAVLASVYLTHFQRVETVVIVIAWLILGVLGSVTLAVWPETITVEGFIRDTAGEPVNREKVVLVDVNGIRRETNTDDAGHYRFQDVPHGAYTITAREIKVEGGAQGFLVWRVITGLTVPQPPPTPVVIFTFHNKFVTVDSAGVLKGDVVEQEGAEKFTLIYLGDKVALGTSQGGYITVIPGEPWRLEAEISEQAPGPNQQFTLINLGDGRVAFRTVYNKYFSALNDEPGRNWEIRASANEILAWEKFTLIPCDW